jgi:hypothetical protein
VTPPDSSTLTIGNTGSATPGEYDIEITGSATSGDHTTMVALEVVDAPDAPLLLSPPFGAINQPLQPTFTWSAVAGANSYTIEIATDIAFSNVVDSASVATTEYTPAAELEGGTSYYWRVSAENDCGTGAFSQPGLFTTEGTIVPGVDVPASMSDSGAPGTEVTYSIVVTNTGSAADTFEITVTGNSWQTDAPATTGILAPGASTTIEVVVTVGESGSDTATVTFTSGVDDSVSDSVVLTTTAGAAYMLYLPVATNN